MHILPKTCVAVVTRVAVDTAVVVVVAVAVITAAAAAVQKWETITFNHIVQETGPICVENDWTESNFPVEHASSAQAFFFNGILLLVSLPSLQGKNKTNNNNNNNNSNKKMKKKKIKSNQKQTFWPIFR